MSERSGELSCEKTMEWEQGAGVMEQERNGDRTKLATHILLKGGTTPQTS